MEAFNFEKAMALARAAERGKPLPLPERRDQTKKPVTQFDLQAVIDRAKRSQLSKHEDRGELTESM